MCNTEHVEQSANNQPAIIELAAEFNTSIRLLREAWSTLHNLSADMEAGPLRQQMQKRASSIRSYLDKYEQVDGTYRYR
jgi:Zn-dependent peptidase ImmA (M78 family)